MRHEGQTRRGSALLTVLWISAALAAVAFSLANTVRGETDRTSTELDEVRGYYLASGAVDRAAIELLWSVTFARNRNDQAGLGLGGLHLSHGRGARRTDPGNRQAGRQLRAARDRLMRLMMALGVEPGPGVADHARDPGARRGGARGGNAFPAGEFRLFRRAAASFQEIEELLSVRGITPEIFYGTYVPAQGDPGPGEPRLIRRSGLVDCLSVFGSEDQVDANTADPAVLAAIGLTPDAVQLLLRAAAEGAVHRRRA